MKKTLSILITLALVLSFSLVTTTPVAAAATYYVATTGSDGNTGGSGDPWLTIQHAVDNVASGDTIMVAAGTYNEAVVINRGLTSLTLNGANAGTPGYGTRGAETIIQAPDVAHTKAIDIWDDGIVVDGFKLMAGLEDSADIVDVRGDHVVIKNNIITPYSSAGTFNPPGVFACDCTDLTVEYNLIQNTGGCGIYLGLWPGSGAYPVTNSLIQYNMIDNPDYTGILAYDTTGGGITIRHNTIKDVGTLGVQHDDGIRAGGSGCGLTIEYNEIYGCTNWGIRIVHDAANHIIHYNSIHDNAQGGLRNQLTIDIDASCNWWGTNTAAGVAGEVSTYVDYTPWLDIGTDTDPGSGFQGDLSALNVDDDSPQTGATGRIQEGVNEVTASTVNVAAGTYTEQVTISKSLTLSGAGKASTTIQAPGTLTGDKAIVTITGASVDVELSGFTVKGPGPGTSNSIFAGIFVKDTANGNIHDNDILDIRDEPISGSQDPHGIWIGCNAKTTTGTATIKDNTISGYQKGGIAVEGSGSTATIEGNIVTGQGPFLALAQDGIRVAFSAGPVSINNNTVTGTEHYGTAHDYECWGGAAIFLREGAHDVDIEGNTLTDNRDGILIGNGGDTLSVDKVNITDNDITDNTEGIHLQCFSSNAPPTNVHITCNDIQSVFPTGCIYYAPDHCYGIIVDYDAEPTNYAHFNNIAGTGYLGLWNGKESPGGAVVPIFDAEDNWWGAASGPYDPSGESGETTEVPPCDSVGGAAMMNTNGAGDEVYGPVDYCPWRGEVYAPTKSVATSTGTGTASFTTSDGNVVELAAAATPVGYGIPAELPHGMFSFKVCCIDPGQAVTLTITLPGPVPRGTKWWKFQGGRWYSLPIGSDNGDNIITIMLTDGVFPGDTDSIPGQITDPGGPGYYYSPPSQIFCDLEISSTEGGLVTIPGEGVFYYDCGSVVSLTATPDAGYHFVNWTGDVSTIDDVHAAETNIAMDGDYSITANFETGGTATAEHTLTISSTTGGSVITPGEGTFPYDTGTVVSLVASPATGYKFVNWTGGGITHADSATTTVTVNGDFSIMANFEFEQTTTDSTGGSSGPLACFIATAAYGTPTAEQIDVLREFRDAVLLESDAGSRFVALYYQLSPPIADFIAGNELLRIVVRELLVDPIVGVIEAAGAIWRN